MKDLDQDDCRGAVRSDFGDIHVRRSPGVGRSRAAGEIRVAAVTPDPVRATSLRNTLSGCESLVFVAHCNGTRRSVRKLSVLLPDVVIVDFSGDFHESAELVVLLRERLPRVRVVAMTPLLDRDAILAAFKAGAAGHVFDSVSSGEMSECVRLTSLGHSHMSSAVAAVVVDVLHQLGRTIHRGVHLRPREREIMALVCEGLVNKEIGDKLCISDNAVKFHLNNVYGKFQVNNRAAAVARYCEAAS